MHFVQVRRDLRPWPKLISEGKWGEVVFKVMVRNEIMTRKQAGSHCNALYSCNN